MAMSRLRLCSGSSAVLLRWSDSAVPAANVADFFSDFARSLKNFARRFSHSYAAAISKAEGRGKRESCLKML
jgi:hypothetical protein